MKIAKQIFVICFYYLLSQLSLFSQTYFSEDFNYVPGTLTERTFLWTESPIGENKIQVEEGSLIYTELVDSTGNLIRLIGGYQNLSGVEREFDLDTTIGKSFYIAFLIRLNKMDNLEQSFTEKSIFANLKNSKTKNCSFGLIKNKDNSKYLLTLSNIQDSEVYLFDEKLEINHTYMIVLKQTFGDESDTIRVWLNPEVNTVEQRPLVTLLVDSTMVDKANIQFVQNENTDEIEIDRVYVSQTWDDVIPQIQDFLFFSGGQIRDTVQLKWKVANGLKESKGWSNFVIQKGIGNPPNWQIYDYVSVKDSSTNFYDEYIYNDSDLPEEGFVYYRLSVVDSTDKLLTDLGSVGIPILTTSVIEITDDKQNYKYHLYENYPNPFNPSTTIKFTIPTPPISSPLAKGRIKEGFVTLKVYDILGREVKTLLNKKLSPGSYEVEFTGNDLSSGIYFYRLASGNFSQTNKMLLMK